MGTAYTLSNRAVRRFYNTCFANQMSDSKDAFAFKISHRSEGGGEKDSSYEI